MWGSDLIAETIRAAGFRFAAVNPGASYRGLHDSLVNYPQGKLDLITVLHDEHAVAVAHGWTKVTDEPALAMLHANVGLMHAVMAIHNAWVDRAPVVILGASGAMDAMKRRPWIEWIHSMQDQAALVRPFLKWDDQPGSAPAAARAIAEARFRSGAVPQGPSYVVMDVDYQETELDSPPSPQKLAHVPARAAPGLAPDALQTICDALNRSQRPVFVFGRGTRREAAWRSRVTLARQYGARVVTDIRCAATFPTDDPNHVGVPGFDADADQRAALADADCVLLFDPIDPATWQTHVAADANIALLSLDHALHRGFVKDAHALPGKLALYDADPDKAVEQLCQIVPAREARAPWQPGGTKPHGGPAAHSLDASHSYRRIAEGLELLRAEMPVALTRLPLAWPGGLLPFRHPLDYLGRDGGEGLASGPGLAVGAALALKGCGRLPVAIIGDGDFMMGSSALWTAANQKLPLLVIVAANGVYGNDVVHQRRVAEARGRPLDNIWIGQRLDDPRIAIADLAHSIGAVLAQRMNVEDPSLAETVRQLGQTAMKRSGVTLLEIMMPA